MNDRRLMLLDRDGTVIRERHYLSRVDQVELLPGAAEGMRELQDAGFTLVLVTNQSGVGRGLFDEQRLREIHARVTALLDDVGVRLAGIYACPHRPADRCWCRKPEPGLVERAIRDLGGRPVWVVGDKPCDLLLGRAVGACTALVRTGYGRETERENERADVVVDDLSALAGIVTGAHAPVGGQR